MNAENKTLANHLVLLNKHMTFKTKTLDTLEGTMFGHDAKVILRTKLRSLVDDGPWSQVQLWVSCGGECLFTWGCVGLEDEQMIRDWWYATCRDMDDDAELSRQYVKQQFLEAQKEILKS
jgi:hypothetical protein